MMGSCSVGLMLPCAPAARRQGRPVFIRRASTSRFVMPVRATAPDAEHQEAERSAGAQGIPPHTARSEQSKVSNADTNRRRRDEPLQYSASQIEARGIACARELLLIQLFKQSVENADTVGLFTAVDADGNAFIDLHELAVALSSWTKLVATPDAPLAAAKNLALDLYLIFGVDPLQGFDKEQFKMVLQSWCLFTKISLEIMAQWMETALDVPGVQMSPEDNIAMEDLDHAMSSQEAMAAAVDAHKIDLVFYLWDSDADGVASRKKLIRALTWYYRLLSQVSTSGEGSDQRSGVIDFLEREQRPGLPDLDRNAFRAVVQRFCELTAVPVSDMCDFLKEIALEGGTAQLDFKGEGAPDAPTQPPDIQDLINNMQTGDQPEPEQAQQDSQSSDRAQRGDPLPDQAQHRGDQPIQPPAGGSAATGRTDEGESLGSCQGVPA
ncbi:g8652 [Coccomyxa elongata]